MVVDVRLGILGESSGLCIGLSFCFLVSLNMQNWVTDYIFVEILTLVCIICMYVCMYTSVHFCYGTLNISIWFPSFVGISESYFLQSCLFLELFLQQMWRQRHCSLFRMQCCCSQSWLSASVFASWGLWFLAGNTNKIQDSCCVVHVSVMLL